MKTTTTKKPETFLEAVRALLEAEAVRALLEAVRALVASDISAGNFEILELEKNGKYGHGKFLFTGTDEKQLPYNYTIEFTLKPGETYADVSIVDHITNETLNTEDMLYKY